MTCSGHEVRLTSIVQVRAAPMAIGVEKLQGAFHRFDIGSAKRC